MQRVVIHAGMVVSPGGCGIIPNGTVVIEAGRIVEVSTRRYSGPEVVDLHNRLLMPSLCNAHLHSEFLLFKGLLEERRLSEWEQDAFQEKAWDRLETPLDETLLRTAYRASYLEQLLNGVTFVGEFNCVDGSAQLAESIQLELGIRGSASAKFHEPRPQTAIDFYSLHHERGLTVEELETAQRCHQSQPDARFTLHAAETIERMQLVQERFGTSTIRLLERYGLLSPRLLLSHAVHVDPEEVALLAARGTCVVASPTAEMKLADGVSPILSYLEAGVPVCLGTDCATCNNDADLFLEMKQLGLLHKLTGGAHVLPAETLLTLGTVNGFQAFGFSDLGRIEVGNRADLITLDLGARSLVPLIHGPVRSNVYATLVYCATGREVVDVMVEGEWVVRAREHVRVNMAETFAALQQAAAQLWREVAGN